MKDKGIPLEELTKAIHNSLATFVEPIIRVSGGIT